MSSGTVPRYSSVYHGIIALPRENVLQRITNLKLLHDSTEPKFGQPDPQW